MLHDRARFDEDALAFDLTRPPQDDIDAGRYHLISKSHPRADEDGGGDRSRFLYLLSHHLDAHVVESATSLTYPLAQVDFDITNSPTRPQQNELRHGKRGLLTI